MRLTLCLVGFDGAAKRALAQALGEGTPAGHETLMLRRVEQRENAGEDDLLLVAEGDLGDLGQVYTMYARPSDDEPADVFTGVPTAEQIYGVVDRYRSQA